MFGLLHVQPIYSFKKDGGTNQNRTGDESFADSCLTAWRWCHTYKPMFYAATILLYMKK